MSQFIQEFLARSFPLSTCAHKQFQQTCCLCVFVCVCVGGIYVCIFCRVLVMIYETQRVAAKKRHLFKCEWTGSSAPRLRSCTASIWMRTWRNTWHQSEREAIACVEPFSGAAVVYFGLTCSVAARGRWQTFYLFLFLLSFFLAAAAPVANLPVEMDPRVETTAVASVCGFRSGFFLELLGAPAAAANKLTVKRNERETKTQKQGTIKVLSSKMAACGEAKELK